MEMAIACSLKVSSSFPVRAVFTSKTKSASLALNPPRNRCFFDVSINGCSPRHSSLGASFSDKTALPHDFSSEQSSSSDPMTINDNVEEEDEEEEEEEDAVDYIRVCDKLIEVFMVDQPSPTDWRKCLAFSRGWSDIRPHFFKRCRDRAGTENDPGMKHKLLKLGRKLKEVDEDVQRHNELLEALKRTPSEINEIVTRRRKDFTEEFFVHLHTVAQSYHDDPTEQDALMELGNACLEAVQIYESTTESVEAIKAAQSKLEDIFNSPTRDAACRKIDNLVEKNQLDSAMTLIITKAWSEARDSVLTEEEAKDILYYLYTASMKNIEKQVPTETRIMKRLLTIEDPEERLYVLKDAFTAPVQETGGNDDDLLYTTPEELHARIEAVIDTYDHSEDGTLISEARDLMNPEIIVKLKELKKLIEKHFM